MSKSQKCRRQRLRQAQRQKREAANMNKAQYENCFMVGLQKIPLPKESTSKMKSVVVDIRGNQYEKGQSSRAGGQAFQEPSRQLTLSTEAPLVSKQRKPWPIGLVEAERIAKERGKTEVQIDAAGDTDSDESMEELRIIVNDSDLVEEPVHAKRQNVVETDLAMEDVIEALNDPEDPIGYEDEEDCESNCDLEGGLDDVILAMDTVLSDFGSDESAFDREYLQMGTHLENE